MEKIDNSPEKIKEMIKDLFIVPRDLMNKWSRITNQTAQVRLAYPGQHLASMITGLPGVGTAARGDDLADGSEVKSCSRADQLGICKNCEARVMRQLTECPKCGSTEIQIKEDSHWIFSIQSEEELQLLFSLPRILLILFDRDTENYIQVRVWEISPKTQYVRDFFGGYFYNNYSVKSQKGESKIAPCNFHPLKYDFFMMNPVKIFHAVITGEDVDIKFFDLNNKVSEFMPISLLKPEEVKLIVANSPYSSKIKNKADLVSLIPAIDESQRALLKMRLKTIKKNKTLHVRASHKTTPEQIPLV